MFNLKSLIISLAALSLASVQVRASFWNNNNNAKELEKLALEEESALPELEEGFEVGKNETTGRTTITVRHKNLNVEVPFFQEECNLYDEKRLEFERKMFENAKTIMDNIIHDMLVEKKSLFIILLRNCAEMWQTYRKTKKDYREFIKKRELGRLGEEFSKKIGQFLIDISKATSKENIYGTEAYDRYLKLIGALETVINKSIFGFFLDFPEMTVNGEPGINYIAPIIAHLRQSGYNRVLDQIKRMGEKTKKYEKY